MSFLIGSCANFYKNNAGSFQDMGLTVNAGLYVIANVLYLMGSMSFVPVLKDKLGGNSLGIILFCIASIIFILAPSYDLYRAHQLRGNVQISQLSFLIELLIASMYIGGSFLFLVGSVYFWIHTHQYFATTLHLISSTFFLGANLLSPFVNFCRFLFRVNRVEIATLIGTLAEQTQQAPVDVFLGNRNLPPLVNTGKIDPQLKDKLTKVTTFCGNMGSILYILGSLSDVLCSNSCIITIFIWWDNVLYRLFCEFL